MSMHAPGFCWVDLMDVFQEKYVCYKAAFWQ